MKPHQNVTLETSVPSLIGQGYIDPTDPQQLPISREDIALVLEIEPAQIDPDGIHRWPHMLHVRLQSGRCTCVSYRSLPGWAEAGEAAIWRCESKAQLYDLAEVVRAEKKRFKSRYAPETLAQWREAWKTHCDRLGKIEARREEANSWKESWKNIAKYCTNLKSFQFFLDEWRHQATNFADLPDIVLETKEILQQRWNWLSQAS